MFIIFSAVLIAQSVDLGKTVYTSESFTAQIKEQFAKYQSLSFVFEGEREFVGRDLLPPNTDFDRLKTLERRYQGFYARRNDKSAVLELYASSPNMVAAHTKKAMLRNKIRDQTYIDNRPVFNMRTKKELTGQTNSFRIPLSPEYLIYTWFYDQDFDASERGFEFLGVEEVQGNQCIKVKIDESTSAERGGSPIIDQRRQIFFIDTKRGFQPVKIEFYENNELHHYVSIELKKIIDANKNELWLPVRSITESFRWSNVNYNQPIFIEKLDLLLGTLAVNSSLGDSLFTLNDLTSQHRIQANFKETTVDTTSVVNTNNLNKIDSRQISKQLDERLAEAEKQIGDVQNRKQSLYLIDSMFWIRVLLLTIGVFTTILGSYTLWKRR